MREKLARLERENVRLRAANNNEDSTNNKGNSKDNDNTTSTPTNASIDELKELLEDEIRLKNRFQKDSREANAKAEALIVELHLFKESQLNNGNNDNNSNNGNSDNSGNSGDANTTQVTVSKIKIANAVPQNVVCNYQLCHYTSIVIIVNKLFFSKSLFINMWFLYKSPACKNTQPKSVFY